MPPNTDSGKSSHHHDLLDTKQFINQVQRDAKFAGLITTSYGTTLPTATSDLRFQQYVVLAVPGTSADILYICLADANTTTGYAWVPASIGGDGAERYVDVQLTATELKAVRATNIEIIAAPATGYAAWPTKAFMWLDHGGTDFVQTNNSDSLALRYTATTEILELGSEALQTAFLEAAADASLMVDPIAPTLSVPIAATAIDIDNNGAAELTTGDGVLSLRVYYVLVPMAQFT